MTNKIVMATESLVQNSGQNPSRDRIIYFHLRYSNGNILLISKSSYLKVQIHLRVQEYNFDEMFKVRKKSF